MTFDELSTLVIYHGVYNQTLVISIALEANAYTHGTKTYKEHFLL